MKIDLKVSERSFGLFQKIDPARLEEISIDFNDQNGRSKTIKKGIMDRNESI